VQGYEIWVFLGHSLIINKRIARHVWHPGYQGSDLDEKEIAG